MKYGFWVVGVVPWALLVRGESTETQTLMLVMQIVSLGIYAILNVLDKLVKKGGKA